MDQALVEAGLYDSRAKAQEAIAAGLVTINGRRVAKAAARVPAEAKLSAVPLYPWVSRGGVKLAAGLDAFAIDPQGLVCLDVGASTGGFTDVLLARGAAKVYALDVGRDQLHARIKADPRVVDWSGTDARSLLPEHFDAPPALIVCDASFISLTLLLPTVLALGGPGTRLLALVKPQFEVGKGRAPKGIVRDEALRHAARDKIVAAVAAEGWDVTGTQLSPIAGGDGNIEYLLGAWRR